MNFFKEWKEMVERKSDMEIQRADIQDVLVICNLVNSAYRGETSKKGWTTEADLLGGQRVDAKGIVELIRAENNTILLFSRSENIVGCVLLQNRVDRVYIGMLTVQPDLQAGGMGSSILDSAEKWASENWKISQFEMTVLLQRPELLSWYGRRGYRQTEKRLPFPYGDERFGIPKVKDLEFCVLEKDARV